MKGVTVLFNPLKTLRKPKFVIRFYLYRCWKIEWISFMYIYKFLKRCSFLSCFKSYIHNMHLLNICFNLSIYNRSSLSQEQKKKKIEFGPVLHHFPSIVKVFEKYLHYFSSKQIQYFIFYKYLKQCLFSCKLTRFFKLFASRVK